ncbi:hypothetical protein ScPMuIL_002683 [Solemya velum]
MSITGWWHPSLLSIADMIKPAATEIRRPVFVWKGNTFDVTCAESPTNSDTEMVLLKDGINVEDLGWSVVLKRNIFEVNTGMNIDEMVCTKNVAVFEDAANFECVTCFGTDKNNCPNAATTDRDTGSIVVGEIQPVVERGDQVIHTVPNPISYEFMFYAPSPETLEDVKWLKEDRPLSNVYVQNQVAVERDGYTIKSYNFTKSVSESEDYGQYELQFKRKIQEDTFAEFLDWKIITVGLTVTGPQDTTGVVSTINCVATDPQGTFIPIYTNSEFSWEYFDVPIQNVPDLTGLITVDQASPQEASVSITPSDASVAGEYTCVFNYDTVDGEPHTLKQTFDLEAPAQVTDLYGTVSYKEGEMLELTCVASGWPKPTIKWYRRDQSIMEGGRVTITESQVQGEARSVLKITGMSVADIGQYYCEAYNIKNPQQPHRRTIDIAVEVGAGLTYISVPAMVWKGETITVTCTNNPAQISSTMVLLKDGAPVNGFQRNLVTSFVANYLGEVDILTSTKTNAAYSDAGTYTCHTCTGVGHTNCPDGATTVRTDESPLLVGAFEPTGVVYLSPPTPLMFTLKYAGPTTLQNVAWTKDGSPLSGFNTAEGTSSEGGIPLTTHTATKSSTVQSDSGTYTVAFTRLLTHTSEEVDTLTGQRSADVVTLGLTIEGPDQAVIGGDTVLQCIASDTSGFVGSKTFSWQFNGVNVAGAPELLNKITLSEAGNIGTLTISNSDSAIGGLYTCTYTMVPQTGQTQTLTASKELNSALSITLSGNTPVNEDGTLNLICTVSGYPQASVSWFRDNQLLTSGPRIKMTQNAPNYNLEITDMTMADAGIYRCRSSNVVTAPISESIAVTINSIHPQNVVIDLPLFVWRGDELVIKCLSTPPVDGTLKIVRVLDDVEKDTRDVGFELILQRDYYDADLQGRYDKATASKRSATLQDAANYRCLSCTGSNHEQCPYGAEKVTEDSQTLWVGDTIPDTSLYYHTVPDTLTMTFYYAGVGDVDKISLKKVGIDVENYGFTLALPIDIIREGILTQTYVAQKPTSTMTDAGSYVISFTRRLHDLSGSFDRDVQVVTVNLIVNGQSTVSADPLTCGVYDSNGQPATQFTGISFEWYRDNQRIDNIAQSLYTITTVQGVSSLTFINPDSSMGGNYRCVLNYQSPDGIVQKLTGNKVVQAFPDVVSLTGSEVVNEGGTITLTCEAYGNPKPTITWYRDNSPILDSQARVTIVPGYPEASLQIIMADATDAGSYQCRATNSLNPTGDRSTTFDVDVVKTNADFTLLRLPQFLWKGETLTMECLSIPSIAEGTLVVMKNNSPLDRNSYVVSESRDQFDAVVGGNVDKLTITKSNVDFSDAAVFRCVSCSGTFHEDCPNNGQTIIDDKKSLIVGVFDPDVNNFYHPLSDPLLLTFSYTGPINENLQNIVWTKGGENVVNLNGFTIPTRTIVQNGIYQMKTHVMQKSNPESTDSGNYMVSFTRDLVSFDRPITVRTIGLNVDGPPVVIDTVALTCGIYDPSGHLTDEYIRNPRYEWVYNNEPIGSVLKLKDRYRITFEDGISYLTFLDPDASIGGKYNCIFKYTKPDGTEEVLEQDMDIEAPAEVIDILGKTTIPEDSTLTLNCRARGYPDETVTWYKDGIVISQDFRTDMTVGDPDHILTIQQMSKADEGTYRCIARNSLNMVGDQASVQVTVTKTTSDSVLLRGKLFAWRGESITISCISIPSLEVGTSTIRLLRNDVDVSSSFAGTLSRQVFDQALNQNVDIYSATKIADLRDAGVYRCVSCSGTSHTNCPNGAQYKVEDEQSLLVGVFQPTEDPLYHSVPSELTFTLAYTGPSSETVENLVWTKGNFNAPVSDFTLTPSTSQLDGFPMRTSTITKAVTTTTDSNIYWVKFVRRLKAGTTVVREESYEKSITVKTFNLVINAPDQITPNTNTPLTCGISNPQGVLVGTQIINPTYQWLYNNVPINQVATLQGRYNLNVNNGVSYLTVLNSDGRHGGEYTCVFSYQTPDGENVQLTVSDTVNAPADVIELTGQTVIPQDSTIRLTCEAWGYPEEVADSSDEGNYKCVATNTINPSGDSESVGITVTRIRPDSVVIRADLFAWRGQLLTISCLSVPTIEAGTIRLLRNDVDVTNAGFSMTAQDNQYDSQLGQVDIITVNKATANLVDAAVYRCVSCYGPNHANCIGTGQNFLEASQSVLVGVLNPDTVHYLSVPSPLTLSFGYTGQGDVDDIEWRKGTVPVAGFTQDQSTYQLEGYPMKKYSITKQVSQTTDSGSYIVTFVRRRTEGVSVIQQNTFTGQFTVQTFSLSINAPERLPASGDTQLTCGISDPNSVLIGTPTYQWRFNGDPITSVPHLANRYTKSVSNGVAYLIIASPPDPRDGGEYTCEYTYTTPDGTTETLTTSDIINSPAEVTDLTESTAINQDGTLNLRCTAYGYPTPTVTWYKDNVEVLELASRDRFTSSPPIYSLRRTGMIAIDEGTYRCTAKNSANPLGSSETTEITVLRTRPDTLVARSSLFVWVGDALTVTCVAMPTVTQTNLVLKRNGVNVASLGFSVNKENNVQDPNTGSQVSMLTAVKTQASMSDGVEYTCVACALSNSQCSGQVYLEAKRTVIVGTFAPNVDKLYHPVPSALTMTLTYTSPGGETLESVVWTKDGRPISNYGFTNSQGTDRVSGVNVITESITKDPTGDSDAGRYQVSFVRRIRAGGKRKKRQAILEQGTFTRVVVVETIRLSVTGPTAITNGVNTVLKCSILDPNGELAGQMTNPSIEWLHNGQRIDLVSYLRNRATDIVVNDESTLTITNSDPKVAGQYTCLYTYTSPSGQRQTVSQIKLVNGPTVVESLTGNLAVSQDQTLTLTCTAYGYPFAAITWLKDGRVISATSDNRVTFISDPPSPAYRIQITDVRASDAGQYTCVATNNLNTAGDRKSVDVVVSIIHPESVTIDTPLYAWRGTSLTITCTAAPSVDQVTLVLLKDGTNMRNTFSINTVRDVASGTNTRVDRLTAVLSSANFNHAGTYTCVACSGNSHVNCPTASRKVEDSRPVLVGRLDPDVESLNAAAPESIDLSVIYAGPGTIESVIWRNDGTSVISRGFTTTTSTDRVSGYDVKRNKISKSASVVGDAGTYSVSFKVRYTDGPIISEDYTDGIDIKMFGLELTVPNGIDDGLVTRIRCKVVDTVGDVTPANDQPFSWEYFGKAPELYRQLQGKIAEITSNEQSTFMISNSDNRIAGEYTCIYSYRSGATVKTIKRTETISAPPSIGGINGFLAYAENDNMEVTCMVYGYPVPSVTWYKDGKLVTSNSRIKMVSENGNLDHKLQITDVRSSDHGTYQCRASASGTTPVTHSVDVSIQSTGSGSGSGLDIPIIIAIVVGVILAAMIIGAICICCILRNKKHHHREREVLSDPASETTESVTEVPEMDPSPKHVLVPVAGYPAEPADYGGFGSDYVLYKGHAMYDRPTHLWRPI